jgi:hypothetical protein
MALHCAVISQGTPVGNFTFLSVPRVGEWVLLPSDGVERPKRYLIEHVLHVPEGLDTPSQTVLLIESEGENF